MLFFLIVFSTSINSLTKHYPEKVDQEVVQETEKPLSKRPLISEKNVKNDRSTRAD